MSAGCSEPDQFCASDEAMCEVLRSVFDELVPDNRTKWLIVVDEAFRDYLARAGFERASERWKLRDTRAAVKHCRGVVKRGVDDLERVTRLDRFRSDGRVVPDLGETALTDYMDRYMSVGDVVDKKELHTSFCEDHGLDSTLYTPYVLERYIDRERYQSTVWYVGISKHRRAGWQRIA